MRYMPGILVVVKVAAVVLVVLLHGYASWGIWLRLGRVEALDVVCCESRPLRASVRDSAEDL